MRRFVRIAGIVLALLLLVVLSLPFLISADRFRPALESSLSAALGRRVTIGSLSLSVLAGAVAADGLAIADDPAFGAAPFLQAKSLKVSVELWPLIFSRKLNVTGLTIDSPEVVLLQQPSGRWNYSSLGGKSAPVPPPTPAPSSGQAGLDLRAKLVRLTGGRVLIGKTAGRQKPMTLDHVNIEVRDFSAASEFPFSLSANLEGGGQLKLAGKAGPFDTADLEMTPLSVTLSVAGLNLATALAATAPDVAGQAAFDASASSLGGRLKLTGKLKTEGLKLVKQGSPARRPIELDFSVLEDLRKRTGVIERGDIHVGAAVASLTGTVDHKGETPELDLKFAGPKMPVPELAEMLPPLGIALPAGSRLEGGVANAAFLVKGPAARLVATGSMALNNVRLANFDLGTKMSVIETLAGIKQTRDTDIETFSANVRMTPEGIAVDEIRFVAPAVGELNGGGTVSPANALDFKMHVTVQTSRSAALSRTALPFSIQGTAANPVFKADVRGMAGAEAKSLLQSEAQKRLQGTAGQAAAGALNKLFGGRKN